MNASVPNPLTPDSPRTNFELQANGCSFREATVAEHQLPRVLVIGAGPAGVAAALQLHASGLSPLLVERDLFPRFKVCGCCVNQAALSALQTLQADHLLTEQVPRPLKRWEMRVGSRVITTELPGGIAISRGLMDQLLFEEAIRRGIEVRSECEAKVLEVDQAGVDVELRQLPGGKSASVAEQQRFDVVIVATGLTGGGLTKWLPYEQSPQGAVGAALTLEHLPGVAPETIHMLCSSLGYVGVVQLEDGKIELATALRLKKQGDRRGRQSVVETIQQILGDCGFGPVSDDAWHALQTTPPLTRLRRVGFKRLLAVGDAASYVEPFTGEGMAWAIESGIAAGQTVAAWLPNEALARSPQDTQSGASSRSDLGEIWCRRYSKMMRERKWICRWLTKLVASNWWLKCLPLAIRTAPWAARWVVNRLNQSRMRPLSACANDGAK